MAKKRDLLGSAALLAALIATASAEYELARAVGYGEWVAGCVPAALDVWCIRAFKVQRDVAAAVVALVLVNAAAHLVSADLIPVSVPLVIAVSAIAPLVLYRVHALHEPLSAPPAPQEPAPVVPEPQEPAKPVQTPTAAKPAHSADPLLPDARKLYAANGKPVPLRTLQAELRIGQSRAQRIRTALAATT
ncbi:hypothetical protein [Streptomyces stelliscabiei]|uniref:Outer membrane biosynthesis protein TonB n=1 Tax=Streptomyces stelliscabiei TaxID=146820 RepID=A0A8I0TR50_9ACTN|nr:hypothetical protein [Streptomyces stelliscabiei]MBE1597127.1 outer membrane biosynthesis protein TonB [Streptomyces stelliscabiei]